MPNENQILRVTCAPAIERITMLGIFPSAEATKNTLQFTLLNPHAELKAGAGIMGINLAVNIAKNAFLFRNSSYFCIFGYFFSMF